MPTKRTNVTNNNNRTLHIITIFTTVGGLVYLLNDDDLLMSQNEVVRQFLQLYEYLSMISKLYGGTRDLALVDNHNPR